MHVCFITLSSHPFRVKYHISIDNNNDNLTIELEQIDTNEKWNAVFPSKCMFSFAFNQFCFRIELNTPCI